MFNILNVNLGQDVSTFFPKKTKSLFHNYFTVFMWIIFSNEKKKYVVYLTLLAKEECSVKISFLCGLCYSVLSLLVKINQLYYFIRLLTWPKEPN